MLIKPMGIGQIIDRSFQFYRKYFVQLMLLMLILFGPIYLLQSLLLSGGQADTQSIFDQFRQSSSFLDVMNTVEQSSNGVGLVQYLVLFLVFVPITVFVIYPIAAAATVHMVRAFLLGESIPETAELLRKAVRRLGQLIGSTVIAGLIYFAMNVVMIITVLIFVVIGGVIAGFSSDGGSMEVGMIIFLVLGGIVLFFGFLFVMSYFVIRFFYYLPFVALGEESLGIGRSWTITRKSFWRLFLMYLVVGIILYIIIIVTSLVIGFFTTGIISELLSSLVTIVTVPLWLVPYVLSFFDLRARNEGMELEHLIQSTIQDNGLHSAE